MTNMAYRQRANLMRHFLDPVESPYVIQCVDGWRETAMQAEDLSQSTIQTDIIC